MKLFNDPLSLATSLSINRLSKLYQERWGREKKSPHIHKAWLASEMRQQKETGNLIGALACRRSPLPTSPETLVRFYTSGCLAWKPSRTNFDAARENRAPAEHKNREGSEKQAAGGVRPEASPHAAEEHRGSARLTPGSRRVSGVLLAPGSRRQLREPAK